MNAALKIFLSMSVSGGLLILALLLGKRFLKDKISRQWQYYIWLVVILRLWLPFGPEVNLLGKTYQAAGQAIAQAVPLPRQQSPLHAPDGEALPAGSSEADIGSANAPADAFTAARLLQTIGPVLTDHLWLLWMAVALGMLIRRVTIYQGFLRYIRAGSSPVSDTNRLDQLSVFAERAGVKRPVELCINPLLSSPVLIGCLRPCIVLPDADIAGKDFLYTAVHELTHYRRRDIIYKWLVQLTVCLHWFNPLVHLMGREITKACEFSCDEAVLTKMGQDSAQDYGRTLLNAMAAVGRYRESLAAVPLSENKQLLKERLGAIMSFKKKSNAVRLLTGLLTLCVIAGAAFAGVYPTAAASDRRTGNPAASGNKIPAQGGADTRGGEYAYQAERYYEAGSLPLFQMVFCRLDEEAQIEWLERIFADRRLTFFGAAVNLLDEDCPQIRHLAETVYADGDIAYFSTLAMYMSRDTLEAWLDRALEDEAWPFQSVLFHALDLEDEFDGLEEKREKEWEEAQRAEYGAAGVTLDGKNYYYQGQLVDIFLDMRANKSFYTLDMNPKGTVNIKIVRNENNEITGVAYMTEAEIADLFGENGDPGGAPDMEIIPVDLKAVAAGETVSLGEYTLSEGDKIWYDISAGTGNGIKVFFAKDGQPDTAYWSVHNLRQGGEPLNCTADMTVAPPAQPGIYHLFLQAADGALGDVRGTITLALSGAS